METQKFTIWFDFINSGEYVIQKKASQATRLVEK